MLILDRQSVLDQRGRDSTLPKRKVARPERFELPTFWFVARRSIQLSYGRAVCAPDAFVGRGVPEILAWPVGGWKLEIGAHSEQSRREICRPRRVFDQLARHDNSA